MMITPDPELETALKEVARRQGIAPEILALKALRERFLASVPPIETSQDLEQRLRAVAQDCGVSLPHSALASDAFYE
jgi:hypothetical protein